MSKLTMSPLCRRSAALGTPGQTNLVGRGVERVRIAILALAGRTGTEALDDEVIHEVVDLQRGHAHQVQFIQMAKYLREQPPGFGQ